jgi:hypothetical protein
MKVGVIGSGDVAKALAAGFLKHGHDVTLGTREPAKLADWRAKNPKAGVGSFADAAKFGEVAVLAVKGTVAAEALRAAGVANLKGKPVIDATNPLADSPPTNGVLKFFTNLDESLMERLQKAYPDLRLVKAFNSVGNARMVNPVYAGGRPTMFICGNDDAAKQTVSRILDQFGWETEDLGQDALDIPAGLLKLSLEARVPAIFPSSFWVGYGGLVSYGPDYFAQGVQAARLAAKILRGAQPGELPVEGADAIDLAVNLRTAGAMNISVPRKILLRADTIRR